MERFRQYFSVESIKTLRVLSENLRNAEGFSDSSRGEFFRQLHTIKGNAQTFGFAAASRLAHELENLLSLIKGGKITDKNLENLFVEAIDLLIDSLADRQFEIPDSFSEKISGLFPDLANKLDFSESSAPEIPPEISNQLSGQEKTHVAAAANAGKTLYGLEINFDSANFAADFKDFRGILSESSEIIAALPSPKFKVSEKIGFQIVFASYLQTAQIQKIAETSRAEIVLNTSESNFSNDLPSVLRQVVKHGKAVAEKLGKQIEFEISGGNAPLSTEKLKLVSDILIHLIRNAADHAVESAGKIRIASEVSENNLKLSVSDDGRGIDLEKVKAKAVEKKIISAAEILDEWETLDLIFLPEFSTAAELTEISGRGIGLDAVKSVVEAADGKVSVESRSGKGTKFEIILPIKQ